VEAGGWRRQEKAGPVAAGDHQHEPNRRHHDRQAVANTERVDNEVWQGARRSAPPLLDLREVFCSALRQSYKSSAGMRESDFGLEAPEQVKRAILAGVSGLVGGTQYKRGPQLRDK